MKLVSIKSGIGVYILELQSIADIITVSQNQHKSNNFVVGNSKHLKHATIFSSNNNLSQGPQLNLDKSKRIESVILPEHRKR